MNFSVLFRVEDTALLKLLEQSGPLLVGALERINARLQASCERLETLLQTFGLCAFCRNSISTIEKYSVYSQNYLK